MTNKIVLEQLQNTLTRVQNMYNRRREEYEQTRTEASYGIMKYLQGEINMLESTIRAIEYFG